MARAIGKLQKRVVAGAAFAGVAAVAIATTLFYPGSRPVSSDILAASRPVADQGRDIAEVPSVARASGNGVIEPVGREAALALDVPGRVAEILVREGEHVNRGAVIARLDDSAERGALQAAEADVSVARAQLVRAGRGLRREEIEALAADANSARARAQESADSLKRSQALATSGIIAGQELTRARFQGEADQAGFEAANARHKAALSGARREDIVVARAQLTAAEARREQARVHVEQKTLRAPWPGTVLQVKLRAGERHSPGQNSVVVLGDTSRLVARIDIDERDVGQVGIGKHAFITVPSHPGRHVTGTVVEVGKRMGRKNVRTDDPVERIDTKVLEVVLSLDERDGLVPGMRVVGYLE